MADHGETMPERNFRVSRIYRQMSASATAVKGRTMACTWNDVVTFASTLPGTVEGTSYGTPALRVGKTFLTRYRPEDDSIVIKLPIEERDMRIAAAPAIYFITEHYRS
jgi:hypothetical protein